MTAHPARRLVAVLVVLPAIAVLAALAGVRRVEVEGTSMVPALQPGDRLAALRLPRRLPRWARSRFVRPGVVVVVRDPRGGGRILVKRVATVGAATAVGLGTVGLGTVGAGTTDGVVVLGDAPGASTDSRTFGPVAVTDVLAVAVYRYGPAGRSGALGPGPAPGGS